VRQTVASSEAADEPGILRLILRRGLGTIPGKVPGAGWGTWILNQKASEALEWLVCSGFCR